MRSTYETLIAFLKVVGVRQLASFPVTTGVWRLARRYVCILFYPWSMIFSPPSWAHTVHPSSQVRPTRPPKLTSPASPAGPTSSTWPPSPYRPTRPNNPTCLIIPTRMGIARRQPAPSRTPRTVTSTSRDSWFAPHGVSPLPRPTCLVVKRLRCVWLSETYKVADKLILWILAK